MKKRALSLACLFTVIMFFCTACSPDGQTSASSSSSLPASSLSAATPEPDAPSTPPDITSAPSAGQTFTMANPAPYPALNQIVDNPLATFSDERVFLKIASYSNAEAYQTDLELEMDQLYMLIIHVHNDANSELGPDGYAQGVKFTLSYPATVDGDASLTALLTAENTTPLIVGSSISVHSTESLRLIFESLRGEPYPVVLYDYALQSEGDLAVVTTQIDDAATISGNIGGLDPGNTADSGAYVYLYFRTEAVED